jgi:ferredoxin-NADP reductase
VQIEQAAPGQDTARGIRSAETLMPITLREFETDLVIAQKDAVAEGVVTLVLSGQDGQNLPTWSPGAHIDLVNPLGLTRQYSLCGDPAERQMWRIGVLQTPDSRGGSRFVHETLNVGDTIHARGPRNHFPLVDAPRYVFIAGGIGVTPILPMVQAAHVGGASWKLYYGGRSRRSMAFTGPLSRYGERVEIWPEDEGGLLPLEAILSEPLAETLVYCCGPEPLLQAVEQVCKSWPTGSLRTERFAAKTFGPNAGADQAFEIVLQRSGITLTVPRDSSVLEVVENARVGNVLASCRSGVCGTCEVGVLEGVPDHRDSVLTEAERNQGEAMMMCVSRSRSSRLVLEL